MSSTQHLGGRHAVRIAALAVAAAIGMACGEEYDEDDVQGVLTAMAARPEQAPAIWRNDTLFDPSRPPTWDEPSEAFWKSFRSAHPFGLQGLVVSPPRAGGATTVIVAEPPPHVSFEDLKAFLPDATVARQPVGHGGALFDVVGTLQGSEEEVAQKLRAMSMLLYRTDYKPFAYTTPFRKSWRDASRFHLDIQPTTAELNTWLNADGARFVPVTGGEALSMAQLTRSPAGGVYVLADAGVVAWWIPKSSSIDENLADVRTFALESDLIIGAVKSGGLLILGRQRVAPFDVLPPLRTETVVLLASVQGKDQLEQSYQRRQAGAGAYSAAFDWAPILLSPELVDTEYGHLLNVADQLLKGWSQHGETSYENFPYPPPASWPFDRAVSKIVSAKFKKDSITFNWNTTGAGYVVEVGRRQVYAPYRTAALPVSYIPGEDSEQSPEIVPVEEQAYGWYNGLNNPTLVRVVQYAALYQIFHNLGVGQPREPAPASHAPEQHFAYAIELLWSAADAVTESDLDALAKGSPYTSRIVRYAGNQMTRAAAELGGGDPGRASLARGAMQELVAGRVAALVAKDLREGFDLWRSKSPGQRSLLARAASSLDGSGVTVGIHEDFERMSAFLSAVAGRARIAETYADAVPADGRSWIHTPVVVMSSAGFRNPAAVGGHNVGAEATRFARSSEVAPGRVEVVDNVLHLNPADVERAPQLVRQVARELKTGRPPSVIQSRLTSLLRDAPMPTPRAAPIALGLPKTSMVEAMSSPGVRPFGAGTAPPPEVAQLSSARRSQITIVKHGDHLWVTGPDKAAPVITSNIADASELAALRMRAMPRSAAGEPLRVELANLSDAEEGAAVTRLRERGRGARLSEDVVAVHAREAGEFRSLPPADYELENPKVRVLETEALEEGSMTRVSLEFAPRRTGLKAALVEIWVRFKGTISDLQLKSFVRAVELRVQTLFGAAARGEAVDDPLIQLQRELKRIRTLHGVEIETQVKDGAGDWHLTTTEPSERAVRDG